MLKPWTRYILYVCSLPTDLVGLLLFSLAGALWGIAPFWSDGSLIVTLRGGSWPVRTWYKPWGGTTLGHIILLNGARPQERMARVLRHERVHVEQFESNAVLAFIFALSILWWSRPLALLVWITLPWAIYGAGMLCAVLRGEKIYRGNHLEEAAYDAADQ